MKRDEPHKLLNCQSCAYDKATGMCKTHKRHFNPDWFGCAHVFDLVTIMTCGEKVLPELLPHVSAEVIKDFCYQ